MAGLIKKEAYGSRLKDIRKELKMTQAQLSSELGYSSQGIYAKVEGGYHYLSNKMTRILKYKLHGNTDYLMFGTGLPLLTDDEKAQLPEWKEDDEDNEDFRLILKHGEDIPISKEQVKKLLGELREEFNSKIDKLLKELE